jgi:hypothetical protein
MLLKLPSCVQPQERGKAILTISGCKEAICMKVQTIEQQHSILLLFMPVTLCNTTGEGQTD